MNDYYLHVDPYGDLFEVRSQLGQPERQQPWCLSCECFYGEYGHACDLNDDIRRMCRAFQIYQPYWECPLYYPLDGTVGVM